MENLGFIEPKKLKTCALDAVSLLLHRALQLASAEENSGGQPSSITLRELLGLTIPHGQEEGDNQTFCLASPLATQLICRLVEKELLTPSTLYCFCKSRLGSITRIDLSKGPVLNPGAFLLLMLHPLVELSLGISAIDPTALNWHHLKLISKSPAGLTLKRLTLQCSDEEYYRVRSFTDFTWLRNLTGLLHLDLHDMLLSAAGESLSEVVTQLPNLVALNLARTSIRELHISHSNLKALSLTNVPVHTSEAFFKDLTQIWSLVSLDISFWRRSVFSADTGTSVLQKLSGLPCLKYLDVSGHTVFPAELDHFDPPHHRMGFLGLLATQACKRAEINSDKVSGDTNEQQFVISLQTYGDRKRFMEYALHSLFTYSQDGYLKSLHEELLLAMLPVLEKQRSNDLLLPASACLWHLTRENRSNSNKLSKTTKKMVVVSLVTVLEEHMDVPFMNVEVLKNFTMCMCNYTFPEDVMFVYSHMARVLVGLFTLVPHPLVQSLAISFMNGIVWQVPQHNKVQMKNEGAIQAALQFIEEKTDAMECDQSLESACSFLWNVTDETPENNEELLNCRGLEVIVRCYKAFKNASEPEKRYFNDILRNLLGSLGNVAEVDYLRPKLLDVDLLELFLSILQTFQELEVQYNIAGIICNLAMEAEELWDGVQPSKDHLLHMIETCVKQWDTSKTRSIQYRSLKPLIAIANCPDERVALWGVWALANLCRVYYFKYLSMLKEEGGVEVVEALLQRARTPKVRELASSLITLARKPLGWL